MKEKIIKLISDELMQLYKMRNDYKQDDFMMINVNARIACLIQIKTKINNIEE